MLYSHPETVVSVILVAVLPALVGATGVDCAALITVAVGDEVTLPLQLADVTSTVIVLLISACANV